MSDDYEIGFGKPPVHSRFKPGISPHPAGRPKRKPDAAARVVENFRNESISYREGNKIRTTTRAEYEIRSLFNKALAGDLKAIHRLLELRMHADLYNEKNNIRIRVKGWLPDQEGQTAEHRNREFAERAAEAETARR